MGLRGSPGAIPLTVMVASLVRSGDAPLRPPGMMLGALGHCHSDDLSVGSGTADGACRQALGARRHGTTDAACCVRDRGRRWLRGSPGSRPHQYLSLVPPEPNFRPLHRPPLRGRNSTLIRSLHR